MNLSENFRLSELFAGIALGAGIVAATAWSAVWIMLAAAVAAMLAGLLTKQWIMTVAVALGLYVALPVWAEVLPGSSAGVPTVGDLIGTTTTTGLPSTSFPADLDGPEGVSVGGAEAQTRPEADGGTVSVEVDLEPLDQSTSTGRGCEQRGLTRWPSPPNTAMSGCRVVGGERANPGPTRHRP